MADAWRRRSDESKEAYAAFCAYYLMPIHDRSIDAAYRAAGHQERVGQRAQRRWFTWSTQYEWLSRASAYDDAQAEQHRLLWERRRRELQERDWAQADALRTIVDQAIPGASQFIRRKTHTTAAGETIITLAFDITALSKVLTDASRLQRLATDQPTENINNLSGAALDAAIARALDELHNGAEAGNAGAAAGDEGSRRGGSA